jgi:hypothetical protein
VNVDKGSMRFAEKGWRSSHSTNDQRPKNRMLPQFTGLMRRFCKKAGDHVNYNSTSWSEQVYQIRNLDLSCIELRHPSCIRGNDCSAVPLEQSVTPAE